MGDEVRRSYLNRHNQCWSIANLFVTDGSCFPSSGWANPALTMMAITGRACAFIAGELERMNM
jgi:choline dehydrogenase-like flavoprotein